jgi:ectoine hydroxylase-related dioxygenase (phytanoyl-CoA dioxygenase family)
VVGRVAAASIATDGFAVLRDVLDAIEVREILEALAANPLLRTKAGARHALGHPAVHELASDARLVGISRDVLGPKAFPFRATLFDKSLAANWLVVWHQDTALPLVERCDVPSWGPWSVKAGILYAHAPASALEQVVALRIHLDDSTERNGPLRVLPGTHDRGVLDDDQIALCASQIPPAICTVQEGGVLVMRPLILHSSSKALDPAPRRVLHIEYSASRDVGDGLQLAIG